MWGICPLLKEYCGNSSQFYFNQSLLLISTLDSRYEELNVCITTLFTFACRKRNHRSLITTVINCRDVGVIRTIWRRSARWDFCRVDKRDKQREISIHNVSDEFLLKSTRIFFSNDREAFFWTSYLSLSVLPALSNWPWISSWTSGLFLLKFNI